MTNGQLRLMSTENKAPEGETRFGKVRDSKTKRNQNYSKSKTNKDATK
jgi:hypothetical protein